MNNAQCKPELSVFDFDGTLTFRDSFTLFLRHELGFARYAKRMTGLAIPTSRFLLGSKTRDQLKARLIRHFLTGISVADIEHLADDFCKNYWSKLMRPRGCKEVAEQLRRGATVTLCSASPELVLQPFADRLGICLIATKLQARDGVLTGEIDGHNCRQEEKVKRLVMEYGDLKNFHVRAWGDSAGDKQLLEAADEHFYRLFH